MYVRHLQDCEEFLAGDSTRLRELLHPDKADLDLRYSLAHASLDPGTRSQSHRLRTSEVYYIVEGEGHMHIHDEVRTVRVGDAIYIPPGAPQFIENRGNVTLKFLCIVDPAWRLEDEEVLEAEPGKP